MQEFLAIVTSFPTIVFSFALAVVLLYWLVLIFGALDLDFLDSALGIDAVDGAFDGAVESLDGAAEGAADAVEGDVGDGSTGGLLAGLLTALGVRGVPITVTGTLIVFWSWILSYLATRFLGSLAASAVFGFIIAVVAVLTSLVLAAMTSRPFRKLFVSPPAPRRASLVGKMCTVSSASVDQSFGRAEIDDGAAGFVAEVRCPTDNALRRGSRALVYRYEAEDGVFFIGPVDDALTQAGKIANES